MNTSPGRGDEGVGGVGDRLGEGEKGKVCLKKKKKSSPSWGGCISCSLQLPPAVIIHVGEDVTFTGSEASTWKSNHRNSHSFYPGVGLDQDNLNLDFLY